MAQNHLSIIRGNRQISKRFYRLKLELVGASAQAFAEAEPGQFAQLDLANAALPPLENIPEDLADVSRRKILLRRPFSFCDITTEKDKTVIGILYAVIGPATLRMTTLKPGDSLSVIGPLGNGFGIPKDKKKALLIIGGMGAGPLQHLAKVLSDNHTDVEPIVFAGAKTAGQLPFEKPLDQISQGLGFSLAEFARYGVESLVATDDGSAGFGGFVTDCLSDWLSRHKLVAEDTIIFSCGPEVMLAKVAEIADQYNIDCQVSMERMMACGISLCQGCAVKCKVENSDETVYKMCCKDGPIFDSREVVFQL